MRPLPNFNFSTLTTYPKALAEIENQIKELMIRINECDDVFTNEDRDQLVKNIQWLKKFYEAAERGLLNDNG